MPKVADILQARSRIGTAAIALGYSALGSLYILFSDSIVANLFASQAMVVGTFKGIIFILVSGTALYVLLRRMADQTERDAAALRETTDRLTERVKEMRCLQEILRLCHEEGKAIEGLLNGVVRTLPAGMKHPSAAAVRLTIGGGVYLSGPFPAQGPSIRCTVDRNTGGGLLEVAYRTHVDAADAFLREERSLVQTVAAELAQALDRRHIAATLHLRDRGLAAAPTGICIAEEGQGCRPVTYVNPAFLTLCGYDENEVIGRDCRFLQGPETNPMTVDAIRASLRAGRRFAGEIVNYRKSGESFWNDIVVSPIRDGEGVVTHFVGVMRDASERHRSQERIRLLESAISAAASAIVITDADGRVEYVNDAFRRITGYESQEIAGRTLRALKSDEHDEAFYRDLWATILDGRAWRSPIVNRRKDGTLYRASQVIAPIRDTRGKIAHFVAIQEDTTALHEAEEQLRHAQRLQAIGQLTGGIAHDFNNILAVVLGNLELLGERTADRDIQELLADPLEATMRGAELTKRLLAFARLQPLQPQPVAVKSLVARIVDLIRPALTEAIEIRMSHAPDLWQAFIDGGQLETALLNIALNARDAMPDGGVLFIETNNATLDADYAAVNQEVAAGDYVMIAITDTGAGMSPDVAAKAFDPFFTTKEAGRGLGLSMVYGFAKQSGGHVRIYSEIDGGTSVRLYLPSSRTQSPSDESDGAAGVKGNGRTILIVEDDERVARWIVRALEAAEFRVIDVRNAADALTRIAEGVDPDMLLTDIVLPGGATGVRLAADLSERGCRAKVLFMSGYSRDAVSDDEALPTGARLLTKPFRRAELLQQVQRLFAEEETT